MFCHSHRILRLTQFDISYMRIKQVEIYIQNEVLGGWFIIILSVHVFVCVVYFSLLVSYSTKLVRLSYLLYDGGKYLFQLTFRLGNGVLFVFVFCFYVQPKEHTLHVSVSDMKLHASLCFPFGIKFCIFTCWEWVASP